MSGEEVVVGGTVAAETLALLPSLLEASCQLPHLSLPQFPHLLNGDYRSTDVMELYRNEPVWCNEFSIVPHTK